MSESEVSNDYEKLREDFRAKMNEKKILFEASPLQRVQSNSYILLTLAK